MAGKLAPSISRMWSRSSNVSVSEGSGREQVAIFLGHADALGGAAEPLGNVGDAKAAVEGFATVRQQGAAGASAAGG